MTIVKGYKLNVKMVCSLSIKVFGSTLNAQNRWLSIRSTRQMWSLYSSFIEMGISTVSIRQ